MDKLFLAVNALKAGESLRNAATWKNIQMLMNALLVILGATAKFANMDIPESDLNSIAYGLSVFGVTMNTYFTAATSEKVGV